MPLTKDVGHNIGELSRAHPDWSRKRVVAAALNGARAKGKRIPAPASKRKRGYARTRKKR